MRHGQRLRVRTQRRWPCARLAPVLWLLHACTGSADPPAASPSDAGPPAAPVPGAPPAFVRASAATPPAVAACAGAAPGPAFHRLSRTEYHNTVNELLGTRLPLRDLLPADPQLYGFDNDADTAVSAPLVQRYFDTARFAVAAALAAPVSRAALVPCAAASDPGCTRRVLERFLPRAFRRPVQPSELDEQLQIASLCDESAEASIACALEAALVAPDFLFRSEVTAAACEQSPAAGAFALASRLSFFLWSSGPDQELLDLAASGHLGDDAVIEAQVNRMLAPDAQARFARAFVQGLPVQWLGLDGIATAAPSPALYPGFDDDLRAAMTAESQRFFAELVQQNRSALELVRAPFTFANERLARHYGMTGVTGMTGVELRQVDTRGSLRGGVLGQASFLVLTSSSERASVAARARWVLQNLLCSPLPDPPPGAQEMVPPPDPALGLTRRQSLERRTAGAACSSCHAVLNPIGFGLDVFDAVGAERALEHGQPIDTHGVLPSGERFADTGELLTLLQADPRFPVCLTQKLLTYALGRALDGACDEAAVRVLAEALAADGYRLGNHVVRIAKSELFRAAAGRTP